MNEIVTFAERLIPLICALRRWNGAYAICTRWSSILRRNRCGWRTRGGCC